MATTEPIRNMKDVAAMLSYCKERNKHRNYCLLSFGLHTALRVGDILKMRWEDVYDFEIQQFKRYISLVEQKTKKSKKIYISDGLRNILGGYKRLLEKEGKELTKDTYIFISQKGKNKPITKVQAYRITWDTARAVGISGVIGCHSLRKTFGHSASRNGAPLSVLVEIFNHSSFAVTKRYLGINQDDKDEVYKNISMEFDFNGLNNF